MRTVEQAIAWTKRGQRFEVGWCKRMCRTAYGVPSDGSDTAVEAWSRTKVRGAKGTVPPRGALVWYVGGSHGAGHVAISEGNGMIRSTDAPVAGMWGSVPRSWPETHWGMLYVGWSRDIDGATVVPPPKPKPKPPSRLAKLRAQLDDVAADSGVGPVRRARARAAAAVLRGLS